MKRTYCECDDAESRPVLVALCGLHVDAVVREARRHVSVVLELVVHLTHCLVEKQARVVRLEGLCGEMADDLCVAIWVQYQRVLLSEHVPILIIHQSQKRQLFIYTVA